MALPSFIYVLLAFLKPALMFIGAAAIFFMVFLKIAPKLPPGIADRVQDKLIRKGVAMGGSLQMLVEDSDGVLTLAPAEYDGGNGGYWAHINGDWQFFSAEGKGGGPKWFYGGNVVLAYDGLGAVADMVSGEIGRQAKVKKQVGSRGGVKGGIAAAKDRLLGDQQDALPDGGSEEGSVWEAYLPERAVVDLRDTLYNAPFHVRPAQFHRVEENAKAGQSVGMNENIVRFGLLITGFMLAIIAQVVLSGGGGGGGATNTLPMTLAGVGLL